MNGLQQRILIIEDNNLIRKQIVDILNMENYLAIEAVDGNEGLKKAQTYLPDLIISDILMPKLDGIGLIKVLRKNELTEDIPFIFLSALSDNEYIRTGISLGADDYITKPINIDDLIKSIKLQLRKKEKIENKINDLRNNIRYNFPHEFRTPLNSILGLSYLLKTQKQEFDDKKVKEFANYINKSGKRLLDITNKYLLITELLLLQTDKDKLLNIKTDQTINIEHKIILITQELKDKYKFLKDINIKILNESILINTNHFSTIFTELISNAIKFSNNNIINIYSKKENNTIMITVENIGNGISHKQINNISAFMQFNREKQEQQGLGLGLYIVKLITDIYDLQFKIETKEKEYFKVTVVFDIV